jgi:hypothetical protein
MALTAASAPTVAHARPGASGQRGYHGMGSRRLSTGRSHSPMRPSIRLSSAVGVSSSSGTDDPHPTTTSSRGPSDGRAGQATGRLPWGVLPTKAARVVLPLGM